MNYYDFIISSVKEAGESLMRLSNEKFDVNIKNNDPRDIITSVDLEINKMLINRIKENFPEHNIYSEESEGKSVSSEFLWVIDPIDGTANFARRIPHFAICLGLLQNMIPIAGAVYNPITNELFSFEKGKGAYLNNKQITVSKETELRRSFVFLHTGKKQELWDWGAKSYRTFLKNANKTANYGGSALDACFVASGRIEAAIYGGLSTLDIASAIGILLEAGGKIINENGKPANLISTPQKVIMANNDTILESIFKII